jgi:endo-1,4-beta-D-glucanase Y
MRHLLLMLVLSLSAPLHAACQSAAWPLWKTFAERHLQADGRIIDYQSKLQHSTSEGQAYGMFFALVANDRAAFDRMLAWTDDKLAGGQLGARLPGWQWNAEQGLLDKNSASDADLWLAYDLIEAGRLWQAPELTRRGMALLDAIAEQEVVTADGLGPVLLPGNTGFIKAEGQLRLNPSYSPLPVLRRLATVNPTGPWLGVAESSTRMIVESTPRGMAADWVGWQNGVGFIADGASGAIGSYDAVRVYLWLGMSGAADPLTKRQSAVLGGPALWLAGHANLPEKVDTIAGSTSGIAPPGFRAAILPYLKLRGDMVRYEALRTEARKQLDNYLRGAAPEMTYYDLVLSLFGFGWSDGRFRFSPQGVLETPWEKTCRSVVKRSR